MAILSDAEIDALAGGTPDSTVAAGISARGVPAVPLSTGAPSTTMPLASRASAARQLLGPSYLSEQNVTALGYPAAPPEDSLLRSAQYGLTTGIPGLIAKGIARPFLPTPVRQRIEENLAAMRPQTPAGEVVAGAASIASEVGGGVYELGARLTAKLAAPILGRAFVSRELAKEGVRASVTRAAIANEGGKAAARRYGEQIIARGMEEGGRGSLGIRATIGGGMFGLADAAREALHQGVDQEEFSAAEILKAGGRGVVLGGLVSPAGRIPSAAARIPVEAGIMTGAGAAMQGEIPTPGEFGTNLALFSLLHGTTGAQEWAATQVDNFRGFMRGVRQAQEKHRTLAIVRDADPRMAEALRVGLELGVRQRAPEYEALADQFVQRGALDAVDQAWTELRRAQANGDPGGMAVARGAVENATAEVQRQREAFIADYQATMEKAAARQPGDLGTRFETAMAPPTELPQPFAAEQGPATRPEPESGLVTPRGEPAANALRLAQLRTEQRELEQEAATGGATNEQLLEIQRRIRELEVEAQPLEGAPQQILGPGGEPMVGPPQVDPFQQRRAAEAGDLVEQALISQVAEPQEAQARQELGAMGGADQAAAARLLLAGRGGRPATQLLEARTAEVRPAPRRPRTMLERSLAALGYTDEHLAAMSPDEMRRVLRERMPQREAVSQIPGAAVGLGPEQMPDFIPYESRADVKAVLAQAGIRGNRRKELMAGPGGWSRAAWEYYQATGRLPAGTEAKRAAKAPPATAPPKPPPKPPKPPGRPGGGRGPGAPPAAPAPRGGPPPAPPAPPAEAAPPERAEGTEEIRRRGRELAERFAPLHAEEQAADEAMHPPVGRGHKRRTAEEENAALRRWQAARLAVEKAEDELEATTGREVAEHASAITRWGREPKLVAGERIQVGNKGAATIERATTEGYYTIDFEGPDREGGLIEESWLDRGYVQRLASGEEPKPYKPDLSDFTLPAEFEIDFQGTPYQVNFEPRITGDYMSHHLEFIGPKGGPISDTGYHSDSFGETLPEGATTLPELARIRAEALIAERQPKPRKPKKPKGPPPGSRARAAAVLTGKEVPGGPETRARAAALPEKPGAEEKPVPAMNAQGEPMLMSGRPRPNDVVALEPADGNGYRELGEWAHGDPQRLTFPTDAAATKFADAKREAEPGWSFRVKAGGKGWRVWTKRMKREVTMEPPAKPPLTESLDDVTSPVYTRTGPEAAMDVTGSPEVRQIRNAIRRVDEQIAGRAAAASQEVRAKLERRKAALERQMEEQLAREAKPGRPLAEIRKDLENAKKNYLRGKARMGPMTPPPIRAGVIGKLEERIGDLEVELERATREEMARQLSPEGQQAETERQKAAHEEVEKHRIAQGREKRPRFFENTLVVVGGRAGTVKRVELDLSDPTATEKQWKYDVRFFDDSSLAKGVPEASIERTGKALAISVPEPAAPAAPPPPPAKPTKAKALKEPEATADREDWEAYLEQRFPLPSFDPEAIGAAENLPAYEAAVAAAYEGRRAYLAGRLETLRKTHVEAQTAFYDALQKWAGENPEKVNVTLREDMGPEAEKLVSRVERLESESTSILDSVKPRRRNARRRPLTQEQTNRLKLIEAELTLLKRQQMPDLEAKLLREGNEVALRAARPKFNMKLPPELSALEEGMRKAYGPADEFVRNLEHRGFGRHAAELRLPGEKDYRVGERVKEMKAKVEAAEARRAEQARAQQLLQRDAAGRFVPPEKAAPEPLVKAITRAGEGPKEAMLDGKMALPVLKGVEKWIEAGLVETRAGVEFLTKKGAAAVYYRIRAEEDATKGAPITSSVRGKHGVAGIKPTTDDPRYGMTFNGKHVTQPLYGKEWFTNGHYLISAPEKPKAGVPTIELTEVRKNKGEEQRNLPKIDTILPPGGKVPADAMPIEPAIFLKDDRGQDVVVFPLPKPIERGAGKLRHESPMIEYVALSDRYLQGVEALHPGGAWYAQPKETAPLIYAKEGKVLAIVMPISETKPLAEMREGVAKGIEGGGDRGWTDDPSKFTTIGAAAADPEAFRAARAAEARHGRTELVKRAQLALEDARRLGIVAPGTTIRSMVEVERNSLVRQIQAAERGKAAGVARALRAKLKAADAQGAAERGPQQDPAGNPPKPQPRGLPSTAVPVPKDGMDLAMAERRILELEDQVDERADRMLGQPGITPEAFAALSPARKLVHLSRRIMSARNVRHLSNILEAPRYQVAKLPHADLEAVLTQVSRRMADEDMAGWPIELKRAAERITKGNAAGVATGKPLDQTATKRFVFSLLPSRLALKGHEIVEPLRNAYQELQNEWNWLNEYAGRGIFRDSKGKLIKKGSRESQIIWRLLNNAEEHPAYLDRPTVLMPGGNQVAVDPALRTAAKKLHEITDDFRIRMGLPEGWGKRFYATHILNRQLAFEPALPRDLGRIETLAEAKLADFDRGELGRLLGPDLKRNKALQIIDALDSKQGPKTMKGFKRRLEIVMGADERTGIPDELYNPYLKKRKGETGLVEDALLMFESYTRYALRKVHLEPTVESIKPVVEAMHGKGESATLFGIGAMSQREYAEQLLQHVLGRPSKLDLGTNALAERINDLTRGKLLKVPILRSLLEPNLATRASTTLTKIQYLRLLGASFSSAVTNLTQSVNTVLRFGLPRTLQAMVKLATPSGFKAARAEHLMREFKPFFGGPEPFYAKPFNLLERALLSPFSTAEGINRGVAYLAGLEEAARLGLSAAETVKLSRASLSAFQRKYAPEEVARTAFTSEQKLHARKAVLETQFGYSPVESAPYLGTPSGRVLLQFFSYPTQQAAFMWDGITSAWRGKEYSRFLRFVTMAGLMAGGAQAIAGLSGWDVRNLWSFWGVTPRGLGPNVTLLLDAWGAATGNKLKKAELRQDLKVRGIEQFGPKGRFLPIKRLEPTSRERPERYAKEETRRATR